MKNITRKAVPVVLCAVMLTGSALTSCSKSGKGKVEKIGADAPWFTVETTKFGEQYDPDDYEYIYQDVMGRAGDNILVMVSGYRPIPDDFDYMNDDYSQYMVNVIDVYDLDGTLTSTIDLGSALSDSGLSQNAWLNDVYLAGSQMKVLIDDYDEMTYESTEYVGDLDPETGTITNIEPLAGDGEDQDTNMYNEGNLYVDEYSITRFWVTMGGADNSSYVIDVTDGSGDTTRIDLREELRGTNIYDISTIIYLGGGKAIAPFSESTTATHDKFIMFDFAAGTASEYTEDMSWFTVDNARKTVYNPELGTLIADDYGIKRVNWEEKKLEDFFSFDSCNVNRSDIQYMDLISADENRIVYSGTVWETSGINTTSTPTLVVFDRAAENPNVGKTYITASVVDYLDRATAEAIVRFNDTNPDYFIRFTDKYDLEKYAGDMTNIADMTAEDWTQRQLDITSAMSNQLAMDLMSGDGPDIIFNTLTYSQLNNSDYLVDLTDMISGDGYFNRIFEACKTDGKLYQIPLNFTFQGIVLDSANVPEGQNGFTYEQYPEFVDTVCNGTDPLELEKLDAFTTMLSAMSEMFRDANGRINYDNDEFRALAEFVNENVTYVAPDDDMYEDYVVYGGEQPDASYIQVNSISDLLERYYGSNISPNSLKIMGIPSADGRGPSATVSNSIGISASSPNAEGCRELVNILLSTEIQTLYAKLGTTPVSIEGFRQGNEDVIENYNREIQRILDSASYEEIASMGYSFELVDDSFIDTFEAMIDSCGSVTFTDPAVMSIVREEMPAYFEGQKTLDEVIDILQNRVQTYTNERG